MHQVANFFIGGHLNVLCCNKACGRMSIRRRLFQKYCSATACADEFWKLVKPGCEILALDIGGRITGLAISRKRSIARPMGVLRHSKNTSLADSGEYLLDLVNTHGVNGLVVGWPLEDFTYEGRQCRRIHHQIAGTFKKHPQLAQLPLLLRDESYTTKDVEETGIMLLKRDFKKDGVIDELVAANMLQDVLDEMPSSL